MSSEIDEAGMVRQMVLAEGLARGQETAIEVVGRSIGISRWSAWGIFHGRRKEFSGDLIGKIRRAYLGFCWRQLAKAEADLRRAQERCGDARFEDFEAEIADLARRIKAAQRRAG